MSEKSLDNVLVKFDTKTTSEWAESAKIIAKSALALEDMGNGAFKAKIGDGEHTFAELPYFVSEGITQEQLNQTLQGYATTASVQQGLSGKVDAVEGKGLSSNDYTDADKNKLEGLENYDDSEIEEQILSLNSFKLDKYDLAIGVTGYSFGLSVTRGHYACLLRVTIPNASDTVSAIILYNIIYPEGELNVTHANNDFIFSVNVRRGSTYGMNAVIYANSLPYWFDSSRMLLGYNIETHTAELWYKVTQTYDIFNLTILSNRGEWALVSEEETDSLPEGFTFVPLTLNAVFINNPSFQDEISDLKSYIGYTDSDIYGVEADFENKVFTRLAGAVGKTPGADFDGINAFGGRRRCVLYNNGSVRGYYGTTGYDSDENGITTDDFGNTVSAQVMVEQPRFYYKVVPLKLEKGVEGYMLRKARYYISDTPKVGFRLHPAFIKDDVKLDKVYLSAYEGCIQDTSATSYLLNDEQIADFDTDRLSSIANAKPASGSTQNLTRANARKLAHNRGEGWDQAIIQTVSATQLLFLIEYGTFNSQTAIGIGVTNKASGTGNEAEKTGATSSLGNTSGSVTNANGYNVVSYRGEENLWGNIWPFVDGINIENPTLFAAGQTGTVYVADHDFSDDTQQSPYKNTEIRSNYGSGYISAFGYAEEYDWLFIPAKYTGSSSLPVGDYLWNSNSGWRVATLGGKWNAGAHAGAFSWSLDSGTSSHGPNISARLIYRPTPTQEVY